MDLISLYYFSELAKDLHMTRTANRLFISQQTLSNHIKRLEDSLDVQLFQRKPTFQLTYAGEQVLSFANVVNSEYANLKDLLSDISQQERGVIRFGASYLRMNTSIHGFHRIGIRLRQRLHHDCDNIAVVSKMQSFKDYAVGKRPAEAF